MRIEFRRSSVDEKQVNFVFVCTEDNLEIAVSTWPSKSPEDPNDERVPATAKKTAQNPMGKAGPIAPARVYITLNKYLAQFSAEDSIEMFNIIGNAIDSIENERSPIVQLDHLCTATRTLLDGYMNLHDVEAFVESIGLEYPESVLESFNERDSRMNRTATYIQSEYRGLVAVTLCCQLMAPLWREYINNTNACSTAVSYGGAQDKETSSKDDSLKESQFLRTLMSTKFIDSEEINRLYQFICVKVDALESKFAIGASVNGVGKDKVPELVLANILLSKLCVCDVMNPNADHVVVATNKAVTASVTRITSSNGRMYKRDNSRTNRDDDGSEPGFLEAYVTHQKIADNVFITTDLWLKDYRRVSSYLDTEIKNKLIVSIRNSLDKHYGNNPIQQHHLYFCQWVLARSIMIEDGRQDPRQIISPRVLSEITRDSMFWAISIVAAALITWKFRDLASVLLSTCSLNIYEDDSDCVSCQDAPSSIDSEVLMRLDRTHKYSLANTTRQNKGLMNPAKLTIDYFVDEHSETMWNLQANEDVLDALDFDAGDFEMFKNIRTRLAELFILIS